MSVAETIVDLLQRLVRAPSRAGVDSYRQVAEVAQDWFVQRRLPCRPLKVDGQTVALVVIVDGAPGRHVQMLNATLDTAGFGSEERWTVPPTSAEIHDGWMYGRGTADSKAGVAIFSQLAAELATSSRHWAGRLVLLLDLDEHTGRFAGARRYFESNDLPRPDGVFIGYPGNARIAVGSRGFFRAVVTVHGRSVHSGGSRDHGVNAIGRASRLVLDLSGTPLADRSLSEGRAFGLPPQLTITEIRGGQGFSMVPDACTLSVDVRLTPGFGPEDAKRVCLGAIMRLDADAKSIRQTQVEWRPGWPAYRVSDDHRIVHALRVAAASEFGRPVPTAVVGPSNVGNHLSSLGIPATCGFGPAYRNIHATDECIELASLEPVYRVYREALYSLYCGD